jgi:recombination protein RecT
MSYNQASKPKPKLDPAILGSLVQAAEERFSKVASAVGNGMVFQQEALFAMQALLSNETLAATAHSNPVSFKMAMAQIATAGLTLNPAMGLAYLVPRDGKVIADVSYRGLIKIATDSRAVNLVVAESVYTLDVFRYRGSAQEPTHDFDPFLSKKDRGEFRGVYVKAYLAMGGLLVSAVSAEDIYKARDMSSAWAKGSVGKKGPWESHFNPMCLKAGIKIARKFWPMTSPVLENIISYLNEDGGEGFAPSPITLDVAGKELDRPLISADETIAMPVVDINSIRASQSAQPVAVVSQQDVPQNAVVGSEPSGRIADQGSTNNIDPKVMERINKVLTRSTRSGAWGAAFDWAEANLTGADHTFAVMKFREGESLKKAG